MNPELLIPIPDPVPAHPIWFNILLNATFILHLLCMNTMLGISIIALVHSFLKNDENTAIGKVVSSKLPYVIAVTVNMGVAPLLFIQVLYGQFIYTSSILMATYWLSIVLLLLVAYYCAYIYDFKFEVLGAGRILFIGVTTVLLLCIGFFFSNNMTLMVMPDKWIGYFSNPSGTLLNLSEPTLMPRFLHIVASSIAVGGLFLAVIYKVKGSKTDQVFEKHIRHGMNWFSYATIAQFLIGTWFLLALPDNISGMFMGRHVFSTILFGIGLAATVLSLIFGFTYRLLPCLSCSLLTVVAMALMRDQMRRAFLKPYFQTSDLTVAAQYGPFIFFLASLIFGLMVIIYMIRLGTKNKQEAAP